MLLHDLQSRGLIDPPYFLADNSFVSRLTMLMSSTNAAIKAIDCKLFKADYL